MHATARKVVALVGVQFGGPSQGAARLAAHMRHGVNQWLEDYRIMTIDPFIVVAR
jgi:hypothetical protein